MLINIILISIYFAFTYGITLRFVTNSYSVLDNSFPEIINDFNIYSKNNGFDIQLELTLFSEQNNSNGYNDYDLTTDLFIRKKNMYDIFAYDPTYIKNFSPYLLHLEDWLSKEYLDQYSSSDSLKLSVYNGHRYGIPLFVVYMILYSNKFYLNKYGKDIPTTWDELIETSKIIIDEEYNNNNNHLIGYNGFFPDSENAMCSIYQFLYSFRNNVNDTIPKFKSNTAVEALNKLTQIKEKVSSVEMFMSNEPYNIESIAKGNILFSNFWNTLMFENYTTSVLPGKKKGINGSIIGGYNIGINKKIKDERKIAAIKVIEYLISEEVQKNTIIKKLHLNSALSQLYDDEEVCSLTNCKIMKEIQAMARPSNDIKNYNIYSSKAINIFFDFITGKKTPEETLTKIDDITRIYFLSVDSKVGFIIFLILILTLVMILSSISFVFIPKFKEYFLFFSTDLWIIYSLGSVFIIIGNLLYLGELSGIKCSMINTFLTLGNEIIYFTLIYKLILNFPKINNFSKWMSNHKNIYFIIFITMNVILSLISIFGNGFTTKDILLEFSQNFSVCKFNNVLGILIYIYQKIICCGLFLGITFLFFLEWNIKDSLQDIRNFAFTMIINGISQILFILFDFSIINNYILHYTLHISINLLFVMMNQIYIFIIRIIILMTWSVPEDEKMIGDLIINNKYGRRTSSNCNVICKTSNTISNSGTETSSISKQSSKNSKKYLSEILNYHYSTSQS